VKRGIFYISKIIEQPVRYAHGLFFWQEDAVLFSCDLQHTHKKDTNNAADHEP
jgi:hypothetical protein